MELLLRVNEVYARKMEVIMWLRRTCPVKGSGDVVNLIRSTV
jgi:hypothetical protein